MKSLTLQAMDGDLSAAEYLRITEEQVREEDRCGWSGYGRDERRAAMSEQKRQMNAKRKGLT